MTNRWLMTNRISTGMLAITPPAMMVGVVGRVRALQGRQARLEGQPLGAEQHVERPQEVVPVARGT